MPVNVTFPYPDVAPLAIPDSFDAEIFEPKPYSCPVSGAEVVLHALRNPVATDRLSELARGRRKVLIVIDDMTRPTPVSEFIHYLMDELHRAGIRDSQVQFLTALGTHRPMTKDEMARKLGSGTIKRFKVHNHKWDDPDCLELIGRTDQGVPVWINKLVRESDLVIGIGAIMPIEICGFTGGGKILVPGVCGEVTTDEMHWTRMGVPASRVLGKVENPIRKSVDELARKAGLHFIVNVVIDNNDKMVAAVAGDMTAAHREGCRIALDVFAVNFGHEYDLVIADSYPFDIEFWQANKALDTTGEVVKKGGVVILVAPCHEGFSRTHAELMELGYPPIAQIEKLVESGKISHKVVGVHMMQVSTVAVEKARVILVSSGISRTEAEKAGLEWAQTPQKAFDMALGMVPKDPGIAILRGAARMLPLVKRSGENDGT